MYAILSEGALLSLCDRPRYIKKNADSGAYVEAEEEEAIGIAVHGDVYNLPGKTEIPDAPEAIVTDGKTEEYVFRNRARIIENEEATSSAVIEIEEALCELDMAEETNMSSVEEALCELDIAISGGGED